VADEVSVLTLRGVTQRFGQLTAVNDLSFDLREGETLGIAGPNGCGKTTCLNVITGFYPGSGDVLLDGAQVRGRPPHEIARRGIARTFQIARPFASMTVRENVEIGARFGGSARRRGGAAPWDTTASLLALVGLGGKAETPVRTLKLYDRKLTVLAAALATRPAVLLLDEPIGGLSGIEASESLSLFRRLNDEWGISIIIIEHLMAVLTDICDRLLVMNAGEAFRIGTPAEVVGDPAVQDLLLGTRHVAG
jgi:ABC-type branched-subunit amino acid transport system ATPase component